MGRPALSDADYECGGCRVASTPLYPAAPNSSKSCVALSRGYSVSRRWVSSRYGSILQVTGGRARYCTGPLSNFRPSCPVLI